MNKHFYPTRTWFKTVSLTVAVLFLFSQIDPAFGQGLKVNLNKTYMKTLEPELGPGYAAEDFVSRSNAAKGQVDKSAAIDDFRQDTTAAGSAQASGISQVTQENLADTLDAIQENMDKTYEELASVIQESRRAGGDETADAPEAVEVPVEAMLDAVDASDESDNTAIITLTTLDGQEISYMGNEIALIKTQDGTLIENPVFDDEGGLISGSITLTDGMDVVFENGLVKTETDPTGRIFSYSYTENPNGLLIPSITVDGTTWEFDETGIASSITKENGTAINYSGKEIASVETVNGKEYIYEADASGLSTFTKVVDTDGSVYNYDPEYTIISGITATGAAVNNVVMDEEGRIKDADIYIEEGDISITFRDRLITRVGVPDKYILVYSYSYDDSGNTTSVNIHRTDYLLRDSFDLYGKMTGAETYDREEGFFTVRADFEAGSAETTFYFGLEGSGEAITGSGKNKNHQNQGNTQRFLGVFQENGRLYARYREG